MYFKDMETKCQLAFGEDIRAVGWLDDKHPFMTADPFPEIVALLQRHVEKAWQCPIVSMGVHRCELCADRRPAAGLNLFVPTEEILYIAPALITHYVVRHHYSPPAEFIKALRDCPEQHSSAYLRLMERFQYHWIDSEQSAAQGGASLDK